MEVQRRDGGREAERILGLAEIGVMEGRIEHGAVVAEGCGQPFGVTDGGAHVVDVGVGGVARGPVFPEAGDEFEVIHANHKISQRALEEEHVPAPLQLAVGEKGLSH